MRILLLNDYGRPLGGGEVMVLTLRDELRRRGHDARLFASNAPVSSFPSDADYDCFGTTSRARALVQTANPWAAASLRRVMREFRPDVVHVTIFMTQLSPLVLPVLRGVPTVYHAVWYRYVCPTGTKMLPTFAQCHTSAGLSCLRSKCLRLREWVPLMAQHAMVRQWADAFSAIMAVSDAVRDRLAESGIAVDDIIPAPIPIRAARPPLDGIPAVLFAGRLVPDKGVDVLLRAFSHVRRELPDARLTICGDGPARPALEALRRQLGLADAVDIHHHMLRDALEVAAHSAWVHAAPSVWDEPFGLTVAEAMMRGTAVVVSRSGGLPSVVGDLDPDCLVPPRDERALADALLAFLSDRERCERVGAAARASAITRFAPESVVDQFLQHYARLGVAASTPAS